MNVGGQIMKLLDLRKAEILNKNIKENSKVWRNEKPGSFVFILLLIYYLKYYRKIENGKKIETREFKRGRYLIFVSYEKTGNKEKISTIDLNSLLMVSLLIQDTKVDVKVIKQHKVENYEIIRHRKNKASK